MMHAQFAPAIVPVRKRRIGLVVVGLILLCGAGVAGFVAYVWQGYVESRSTDVEKAHRETERAIAAMRYREDSVRAQEAASAERDARSGVDEAKLARNASAGGAAFGLVAGATLIAVGMRRRG